MNIITLCFDMHCAYKPPMMAIAIQNVAASYELIKTSKEYVLAVPGESMAAEAMFCGVNSMNRVDKIERLGLELCPSLEVSVPGLRKAIANIELIKDSIAEVGDHVLVIGRVVSFSVNRRCHDRFPLLSIGPGTRGYRVLVRKGIHRIGIVNSQGK